MSAIQEIGSTMDGAIIARSRQLAGLATRPYEQFFRDHYDFVWRNLRRLGVVPALVDDALQDVFVTAHRRRPQLRADASERAWIYTILRRVAFRYRRSETRRRRKLDALGEVMETEHRDAPAERVDARRFMSEFLEGLGDKRRPVFVMIELEGMTAPEVAQALDLKLNTVYSRLRLSRGAFERAVARLQTRERELELERLLARADAEDNPPAGAAAAAWMLFEPRINPLGAAGGGWSLWSQLAVFASTVVAGTALLALVTPATPSGPSGQSPGDGAGSLAGAAVVRVAPTATPEVVEEPESEPLDVVVAVPQARPDRRARPAKTLRTRAEKQDGVDAEARLLRDAKRKLTDGRPRAALRELQAHADRYGDSVLADLRDAIRISALCEAGERSRARAEAAQFMETHPSSRLAARVADSCEGDG